MKFLSHIFLAATLLFSGCNYLDVVPERDIRTVEAIFEQRAGAEKWLVSTYSLLTQTYTNFALNVAYLGTDEVVGSPYLRNTQNVEGLKIVDGLQMSQDPYGNIWEGNVQQQAKGYYQIIRNANIFIENIDGVYDMTDLEKKQWKAEMKALKAFLYFDLIRHYGPIVLVPENISVDADMSILRQQRVHVDTCFNAVVRLCDEICEDLLSSNERTSDHGAFFSKEAVLALKAKALLYAASPLFNGNEFYSDFRDKEGRPLFSTENDPEKWRLAAEAADVAVAAAEAAGHKLYDQTADQGTDLLNTMQDVEQSVLSEFSNPEFVLEWKIQGEIHPFLLPLVLPSFTNHYNSRFTGTIAPSMKMVEMYYTDKGLPIDADNSWNYAGRYKMSREADTKYTDVVPFNTDVLSLHLSREPRFYACIATDRTYWQRGPKSNKNINYNLLVEAYKGENFGSQYDIISNTNPQNITGYWWKKLTRSDQSNKSYSVSNNVTLPVIRMAELYLMQAEAWNEYLQVPDNDHVYKPLNKVRERAGIPDVLTSWQSYSNAPEKVRTRDGMRDIIHRETDIELALEGHRFWNLRRWKTAHTELNEKQYGWVILGESAQTFYNDYNGPVEVWSKCKFTAPRDYLFPIKAEEILISGMVQNPGW